MAMKKNVWKRLPPIGMRIIKSAAAIAVCYLVSFIRGDSGIVFYSQLAALWCMQSYISDSRKNAAQRFLGTTIGAVYGLAFLLVERKTGVFDGGGDAVGALAVSCMIIVILYTTVLIKKKEASYFSCVVFLSIVVGHAADSNPYLFVWNRFLDTVIGILIGIGVNSFSLPREKKTDVLFISELDDALLYGQERLSDYSRIELNRMLDEGAMFTVSTMRTPAALIEALKDIRLKLPVIAMDGAVLYDIREHVYLRAYVISNAMSQELLKLIHARGLCCFVNVVIDDLLVIFYRETEDPVHNQLIAAMRRSPYRNYVKSEELTTEDVIYFMLLYPKQVIEDFYAELAADGYTAKLKVLKYDSEDYPGYSYIKIFNKNAGKENMIRYLKEMQGLQKAVTFGSETGRYDVEIAPGDANQAVRALKKHFEPVKATFFREKH